MRTQVLSYRALDSLEIGDKVWFDETNGYVTKANWPFDTANLFHGIALRNIIIGEFVTKDFLPGHDDDVLGWQERGQINALMLLVQNA